MNHAPSPEKILAIADADPNTIRSIGRQLDSIAHTPPTLIVESRELLWDLITTYDVVGAVVHDPLRGDIVGAEFFEMWREYEEASRSSRAFIIANTPPTFGFDERKKTLLRAGVDTVISYREPDLGSSIKPLQEATASLRRHVERILQPSVRCVDME